MADNQVHQIITIDKKSISKDGKQVIAFDEIASRNLSEDGTIEIFVAALKYLLRRIYKECFPTKINDDIPYNPVTVNIGKQLQPKLYWFDADHKHLITVTLLFLETFKNPLSSIHNRWISIDKLIDNDTDTEIQNKLREKGGQDSIDFLINLITQLSKRTDIECNEPIDSSLIVVPSGLINPSTFIILPPLPLPPLPLPPLPLPPLPLPPLPGEPVEEIKLIDPSTFILFPPLPLPPLPDGPVEQEITLLDPSSVFVFPPMPLPPLPNGVEEEPLNPAETILLPPMPLPPISAEPMIDIMNPAEVILLPPMPLMPLPAEPPVVISFEDKTQPVRIIVNTYNKKEGGKYEEISKLIPRYDPSIISFGEENKEYGVFYRNLKNINDTNIELKLDNVSDIDSFTKNYNNDIDTPTIQNKSEFIPSMIAYDILSLYNTNAKFNNLIYSVYGISGSGKSYTLFDKDNSASVLGNIIKYIKKFAKNIVNNEVEVLVYDYYGEISDSKLWKGCCINNSDKPPIESVYWKINRPSNKEIFTADDIKDVIPPEDNDNYLQKLTFLTPAAVAEDEASQIKFNNEKTFNLNKFIPNTDAKQQYKITISVDDIPQLINNINEFRRKWSIEDIDNKEFHVLYTTNNPKSSRSYLGIEICLPNDKSITVLDLPGTEDKKTIVDFNFDEITFKDLRFENAAEYNRYVLYINLVLISLIDKDIISDDKIIIGGARVSPEVPKEAWSQEKLPKINKKNNKINIEPLPTTSSIPSLRTINNPLYKSPPSSTSTKSSSSTNKINNPLSTPHPSSWEPIPKNARPTTATLPPITLNPTKTKPVSIPKQQAFKLQDLIPNIFRYGTKENAGILQNYLDTSQGNTQYYNFENKHIEYFFDYILHNITNTTLQNFILYQKVSPFNKSDEYKNTEFIMTQAEFKAYRNLNDNKKIDFDKNIKIKYATKMSNKRDFISKYLKEIQAYTSDDIKKFEIPDDELCEKYNTAMTGYESYLKRYDNFMKLELTATEVDIDYTGNFQKLKQKYTFYKLLTDVQFKAYNGLFDIESTTQKPPEYISKFLKQKISIINPINACEYFKSISSIYLENNIDKTTINEFLNFVLYNNLKRISLYIESGNTENISNVNINRYIYLTSFKLFNKINDIYGNAFSKWYINNEHKNDIIYDSKYKNIGGSVQYFIPEYIHNGNYHMNIYINYNKSLFESNSYITTFLNDFKNHINETNYNNKQFFISRIEKIKLRQTRYKTGNVPDDEDDRCNFTKMYNMYFKSLLLQSNFISTSLYDLQRYITTFQDKSTQLSVTDNILINYLNKFNTNAKLILITCLRNDIKDKKYPLESTDTATGYILTNDDKINNNRYDDTKNSLIFTHCANPVRYRENIDKSKYKINNIYECNTNNLLLFNYNIEFVKFSIKGGELIQNTLLSINPDPNQLYFYSWIFAIFIFSVTSVYTSQQLHDHALIPQNEFSLCAIFILEFSALCALYALASGNIKAFASFLIFFTLFATICLYNIPEDFKSTNPVYYRNCQYSMIVIWMLTLITTGIIVF